MEGSFGNQKQHCNVGRIAARNSRSETLLLFFGIQCANAAILAARQLAIEEKRKQRRKRRDNTIEYFPDFVNASPTRNSLTHKPQRERDILKTSRIGYGDAILFISQRVTQTKIITSDYQIVTFAL